jgi:hypothetical protein
MSLLHPVDRLAFDQVRRLCVFCGVILLSTLCAAPAFTQNRISTLDGEVIVTRGPWRVTGKQVVFTSKQGQLTSIRASRVDWAATERLAARPAISSRSASTRVPQKEPALVLTNEKVAPYENRSTSETHETTETVAVGPERAHQVRVVQWQRIAGTTGGVLISGALRNDGPAPAHRVAVAIGLHDQNRELIATESATTRESVIAAGSTISFHAVFEDIEATAFDSATFTIVASDSP